MVQFVPIDFLNFSHSFEKENLRIFCPIFFLLLMDFRTPDDSHGLLNACFDAFTFLGEKRIYKYLSIC